MTIIPIYGNILLYPIPIGAKKENRGEPNAEEKENCRSPQGNRQWAGHDTEHTRKARFSIYVNQNYLRDLVQQIGRQTSTGGRGCPLGKCTLYSVYHIERMLSMGKKEFLLTVSVIVKGIAVIAAVMGLCWFWGAIV